MAKVEDDPLWISATPEHSLLQVLALGRTAYDPPEARQPVADPNTSDYDRHHKSFLETGARWDEKLQMYVRRDGTHGKVGHLANIYNQRGAANNEPPQSPACAGSPSVTARSFRWLIKEDSDMKSVHLLLVPALIMGSLLAPGNAKDPNANSDPALPKQQTSLPEETIRRAECSAAGRPASGSNSIRPTVLRCERIGVA